MSMTQDIPFAMPDWMRLSREQHVASWHKHGLPSRKAEAFRYLDLTPIQQQLSFAPQQSVTVSVCDMKKRDEASIRLVFQQGELIPTLSDMQLLPKGVIACSLQEALTQHEALVKAVWPEALDLTKQPLACLNLAEFKAAFFLYVPPHVDITMPVHFLHGTSQQPQHAHTLHLIVMGEGSQARIFEEVANDSRFQNHQLSILLEKNAALDHVVLKKADDTALYWRTTNVIIKENARTSFADCFVGGAIMRHDLNARLVEPFAHCATSAFYQARKSSYIDHHIDIQHIAPHTTSDMLFKGTVSDRAKVVFNGRLYVEKNAQKIVAYQANHHLVFSDQAESYSKPELEIYADDVKCKHGATTSAFDQEAIFYLRSRGLSETTAKMLLLDAFIGSIVDCLNLSPALLAHIKETIKGAHHDI